jgi:hypothetical protein
MTTCVRCGAEIGKADHFARVVSWDDVQSLHHSNKPPSRHDFCHACFTRVRVALDWALGGDGGFDAAYIERLESMCCALEFDRGMSEHPYIALMRTARLEEMIPIPMRPPFVVTSYSSDMIDAMRPTSSGWSRCAARWSLTEG